MALDYSVDAVISSAQARCSENTSGLTSTDLVRLFNEEVSSYAIPLILEPRSDYFTNISITAFVVGQQQYFLPDGAIAEELRAIGILDPNGNIIAALAPITIEDVLKQGSQAQNQTGVYPTNYYFQGSDIINVWPPQAVQPAAGYSMQFWFFQRPNEIVLKANCAQIASVAYAGGTVTVTLQAATGVGGGTVLPSTMIPGSVVDLVKSRPPFTRQVSAVTLVTAAGTSLTYAATSALAAIQAGDYVVPTGQSCFFTGLPGEMVTGPLTQWGVVKLMEARSDDGAFGRAIKSLAVTERRFKQYMRKRNTGDITQAMASTSKFKGQILGRRFF